METKDIPYQFQSYEPGVFVELYLPKKSKYQGKLYKALTDGFTFEKVKAHFLDEEKRERIYQLLDTYSEVKNIEERINRIEPFYWGYSMYEVDGVFFNLEKGIIEERTQIIRILFLPNIKMIHKLVPDMEYNDLRRAVGKILKADRDERGRLKEYNQQIVEYIEKWKGDVGLFLFGYIIFELCSRIKEIKDDAEGELEEEIWLSSFWNLQINRVKLRRD